MADRRNAQCAAPARAGGTGAGAAVTAAARRAISPVQVCDRASQRNVSSPCQSRQHGSNPIPPLLGGLPPR
ncbi:MAG: hypothetical protein K0S35_3706 [Geminicoccaceae bacterium]|jgi:hypothetical protein|nr:hypothetical protein [Geminicoccaceae bacterium]